ncbi:MAG: pyridoxamine 5'-phosphate oxidase family protein [Pseudomonadales bacterium]|nr:pyridoxamine 5'-phosphate oxidase family protein [Pseudomonadales bacterium]
MSQPIFQRVTRTSVAPKLAKALICLAVLVNQDFASIKERDTLVVPDYQGNKHFNTLGNILENSKAGLFFIDFEGGDLLSMTGSAEIKWGSPNLSDYPGSERLWTFKLTQTVRVKNALPFRWVLNKYFPFLPSNNKSLKMSSY